MFWDSYGLKSSGIAWVTIFAETLRDMDFVPTVNDPYLYCRQVRKPNGENHFELLLLYVDDILLC